MCDKGLCECASLLLEPGPSRAAVVLSAERQDDISSLE